MIIRLNHAVIATGAGHSRRPGRPYHRTEVAMRPADRVRHGMLSELAPQTGVDYVRTKSEYTKAAIEAAKHLTPDARDRIDEGVYNLIWDDTSPRIAGGPYTPFVHYTDAEPARNFLQENNSSDSLRSIRVFDDPDYPGLKRVEDAETLASYLGISTPLSQRLGNDRLVSLGLPQYGSVDHEHVQDVLRKKDTHKPRRAT